MEHEYWTSRRTDGRRAWVPLLVVGVALAGLLIGLVIAFRDEGPAQSTGPLPSLGTATTTTAASTTTGPTPSQVPTTVPPAVTAAPATTATTAPLLAPAPTTRPRTGPPGTEPDGTGPATAEDALAAIAEESFGSVVSDVVDAGPNRYAVTAVRGQVELRRWSGEAWEDEQRVDVPSPVQAIDTADVTDDGTDDFVIRLSGPDEPGGVLSLTLFRFELVPFNTLAGEETWVDALRLEFGQLVSEATDSTGQVVTVNWTWTGRRFEVLG